MQINDTTLKKIQNVHYIQQGNTKGKTANHLRHSETFSSKVCRTQMFSLIISRSLLIYNRRSSTDWNEATLRLWGTTRSGEFLLCDLRGYMEKAVHQ